MGKLFIIRTWTREVEESRGQIKTIPLWFNFYKVPKYLWNSTGFSLLGNTIGTPLFPDKNTKSKKMITYARICIEVDANKDLPKSVSIRINESKNLTLDYPWKPLICSKCKVFGHCNCGFQQKPQVAKGKGKGWTWHEAKGNRKEVEREDTLGKNDKAEEPITINAINTQEIKGNDVLDSGDHCDEGVTEIVGIDDGVDNLIDRRKNDKFKNHNNNNDDN
ncbi:Rna exonuclease [Thalictrum thalictroides]|uniref:Rna exonuclease n=1 Tax=Thalictrum thalictroides TaxID=46969 RepID=A0A7J6XFT8_THATH|nr:Rna exonuclease [Thalictrum thalictroides]